MTCYIKKKLNIISNQNNPNIQGMLKQCSILLLVYTCKYASIKLMNTSKQCIDKCIDSV